MTELYYLIPPIFTALLGYFAGKGRRAADTAALQEMGSDLPLLIRDYQTAKRRADEYLAKIEEVIMERETWRSLYNDQAGGHDNAQALMLETITRLVHLYQQATGKHPKLDPLIETVRGEWVSTHGQEAREKRGDDGRPKDSERKPD